jgi:hypothetical protein
MGLVTDWRGFMCDILNDSEETTIDASLSTGRRLGNDSFINEAEAMSGKCLVKMKSGWTKGEARKKK